jgi:hypothetical protein
MCHKSAVRAAASTRQHVHLETVGVHHVGLLAPHETAQPPGVGGRGHRRGAERRQQAQTGGEARPRPQSPRRASDAGNGSTVTGSPSARTRSTSGPSAATTSPSDQAGCAARSADRSS